SAVTPPPWRSRRFSHRSDPWTHRHHPTGTSAGALPGWPRSTGRYLARCADAGIADEAGHEIGESLRVPSMGLVAGSGEQGERAPGHLVMRGVRMAHRDDRVLLGPHNEGRNVRGEESHVQHRAALPERIHDGPGRGEERRSAIG